MIDSKHKGSPWTRKGYAGVGSGYIIPLVQRPTVHAFVRKMQAPLSPWTTAFWLLQDGYREA